MVFQFSLPISPRVVDVFYMSPPIMGDEDFYSSSGGGGGEILDPELVIEQETNIEIPELLVFDENAETLITGTVIFDDLSPVSDPVDVILTVANSADADADLVIGTVAVSGLPFSVLTQPLATTLAPGETTQFTIRSVYSGDYPGVNDGVITIPSNDPNTPRLVPIQVNVVLPD